ncbi:hypothetical protein [Naumannella cuiyingiana]|uniref:Lipopolysaccharide export LptBFGC system permease protein LptF n=1 Tax=Naumannella cuiyingiana TaxID=1347891 RepID=A0A7Z0IKX0_9ACTN|nr:hypothetical protein [Naumannella cuiyingiana]NYI70968.1 lipopolysaccharide export LptBFGC system permease protein LptF [Naumannella cuiyingiana]
MRKFIRGLPRRTINLFFGAVVCVTLLMALFPPFYFSVSGSTVLVAGIPIAIWYWIVDAALLGLALWGLYHVENIRGELDEALPEEGAQT